MLVRILNAGVGQRGNGLGQEPLTPVYEKLEKQLVHSLRAGARAWVAVMGREEW